MEFASRDDAPPSLKLMYLDHHYWRAECVRVALHIADIPFEDARMGYDEMYASGALTFGTFPALVVGGKGVLNQTQAIARYIGGLSELYPQDAFLAAKCDEAIDALTDVSNLVTATMQERDAARKIAWREHLVAPNGRMTMLLAGIEALLKQNGARPVPYVSGGSLSVADLALWRAVGWLSSGVLDGISPRYVETAFPQLWALHVAIDNEPKVASWKAQHPRHYRKTATKAAETTKSAEMAGMWIRHTNKGRAFYRRRGDDGSCTLTAPGGESTVTDKPEVKLHALCKAESWFEERWARLATAGVATCDAEA